MGERDEPCVGSWESDSDGQEGVMPDGSEFVKLMTSYLMTRVLNATQFCQLMYWAGKAGIEVGQPFGVHPGSPSGHAQRNFNRKLCFVGTMDRSCVFDMPGHYKQQLVAKYAEHHGLARP